MRRRVVGACCAGLLALVATGRASAFGKAEVTVHIDDGVGLAAMLYGAWGLSLGGGAVLRSLVGPLVKPR